MKWLVRVRTKINAIQGRQRRNSNAINIDGTYSGTLSIILDRKEETNNDKMIKIQEGKRSIDILEFDRVIRYRFIDTDL